MKGVISPVKIDDDGPFLQTIARRNLLLCIVLGARRGEYIPNNERNNEDSPFEQQQ
jgi:hypothetical protein